MSDSGLQVYLAREIARFPGEAASILRPLLRVRWWSAMLAIAVVAAGAIVAVPRHDIAAFVIISSASIVSALVEFLNYAYRGCSRSDVESALNLGQRILTLMLASVVLWVSPGLWWLSLALLVPPALTLIVSLA